MLTLIEHDARVQGGKNIVLSLHRCTLRLDGWATAWQYRSTVLFLHHGVHLPRVLTWPKGSLQAIANGVHVGIRFENVNTVSLND